MKPAALIAFSVVAAAARAQVPWLEAEPPRAFGYQVGALVQGRVIVHVPAGWTLDAATLPAAGGHGGAIELRRIERREQGESGGRRHEIDLEYQVFAAPPADRTFEVAPWHLHVKGPTRVADLRVEAWPVTVAPLVPVEVSPRRGLGELQPDIPPPRVPTRAIERRLLACAAMALLLLGWIAWPRLRALWSRERPFEQAWRALRRLPAEPGDEDWRAAVRSLHAALDRTAGETLFASGLERLTAARPWLGALHADIARFLEISRREFFGGAPREAGDAAWTLAFARRLRDAERGVK